MLSSLDVNMEVRHDKSQAVARVSVSLYKHHLRRDRKCREIRMISKASSGEKRSLERERKIPIGEADNVPVTVIQNLSFLSNTSTDLLKSSLCLPIEFLLPSSVFMYQERDTCEDDFQSSSRAVFLCLLLFFSVWSLLLFDSPKFLLPKGNQ